MIKPATSSANDLLKLTVDPAADLSNSPLTSPSESSPLARVRADDDDLDGREQTDIDYASLLPAARKPHSRRFPRKLQPRRFEEIHGTDTAK